jgi:hypothetical protein
MLFGDLFAGRFSSGSEMMARSETNACECPLATAGVKYEHKYTILAVLVKGCFCARRKARTSFRYNGPHGREPIGDQPMTLRCKEIRKKAGWEDAIRLAEEFCNSVGADKIVSISHVSEAPYGVIFVWYRES